MKIINKMWSLVKRAAKQYWWDVKHPDRSEPSNWL